MNLDNHEKSEFDGGILGLIGVNILSTIITFVTFGLGFTWAMCVRERYIVNHTIINGQRLRFIGSGEIYF